MELALAAKESKLLPKTKVSNENELPQINFTPRLRYFAVGPNKRNIKCPLCNTRCESYSGCAVNVKELAELISCCFLCCFPIVQWPACICMVINGPKRDRYFCSSCKAQLGFYRCPS